jgi:DNA-directed RNA polymerase specialized sigma24 family protein
MVRAESGVDERTMLAFELVALRGVPTGEAAHQCGMSTEQVYVAKSRVTKRLRQIVAQLTEAFEEDV